MPTPLKALSPSIRKRWQAEVEGPVLSPSSRAQPLGCWPESLTGLSSGRGSCFSQDGVGHRPLGQPAPSDGPKDRLQIIGPPALSQDNSEDDPARSSASAPPGPVLLSIFQEVPPRCLPNRRTAAHLSQVCFQGTCLETGVQLQQ